MGESDVERIPIDVDLIGYRFLDVEFDWEPRDLVLYAVAVGADPGHDLSYLDLTRGPRPLPLFPLIRSFRETQTDVRFQPVAFEPDQSFLANSSAEIHRVVGSRGRGVMSREVVSLWDKGSAAIITVSAVVEVDGEQVITYLNSVFVQGAGGFGGDRGPSRPAPVEFTPDLEAGIDIPANSAAIYQLVGDHNPHSLDPDFATQLGLPGPISAGQVVKGAAALALTTHYAEGDHTALREITVDYAGSHFIGAPLTLRAREESRHVDFTVHSGEQPVLTNGRAVVA